MLAREFWNDLKAIAADDGSVAQRSTCLNLVVASPIGEESVRSWMFMSHCVPLRLRLRGVTY